MEYWFDPSFILETCAIYICPLLDLSVSIWVSCAILQKPQHVTIA